MDKKQKELIIASFVVIIALIMVFSTIKKAGGSKSKKPVAAISVEGQSSRGDFSYLESETSYVRRDASTKTRRASSYNVEELDWGRDPFVIDKAKLLESTGQSWAVKLEQLSRLKLTGMMVSGDTPEDSIAVINGEDLKIGDNIFGFIIKDIRSNFVVLESGSQKFMLRLWEEEREEQKKLQKAP